MRARTLTPADENAWPAFSPPAIFGRFCPYVFFKELWTFSEELPGKRNELFRLASPTIRRTLAGE
jgi:hypothetical protein